MSNRATRCSAFIASCFAICAFAPAPVVAQDPLDLFDDAPVLSDAFIRIGSWNLRHINLERGSRDLLPGLTVAEDFEILVATFGKAIADLDLHLVVLIEVQPRVGQPDRLDEIREWLDTNTNHGWDDETTSIVYAGSGGGNLQFGLIWRTDRVSVDTTGDVLLEDLRQLDTLRPPWLVPVAAGDLSFELVVLHLKSGGKQPQAAEVDAIEDFLRDRLAMAQPDHIIVVGDWNIRPDKSPQRNRLRQMQVPLAGRNLMRVLTVEEIEPTLEGWQLLGTVTAGSPVTATLPFTHYNLPANQIDTFLDHIAISNTLSEIFDHPIAAELDDGTSAEVPGVRIAGPIVDRNDFHDLTDHLPVILTLRIRSGGFAGMVPSLSIVGALPNPMNADEPHETVHVRNDSTAAISLDGWRIGDAAGRFWTLTAADGTVQPGDTIIVVRRNRPMALNNRGGETIVLVNPLGETVDSESYGNAASGQFFEFD